MRTLLALALLLCTASLAEAGPRKLAHSFGSQVKRTFYSDVKAHPVAWGLNLALQWGIAYADTASTCRFRSAGLPEVGPAHYFVGHYPSCAQSVAFTGLVMFAHSNAENWLTNKFSESCRTQAESHDPRWDLIPAHTYDWRDCYKWVPIADTIALEAYEIPVIRANASQP
jgi:hypothetical protein